MTVLNKIWFALKGIIAKGVVYYSNYKLTRLVLNNFLKQNNFLVVQLVSIISNTLVSFFSLLPSTDIFKFKGQK